MFMSAADYRESLRALRPNVHVEGAKVASVADDPRLAPGIAALGVTYDFALRNEYRPLMVARQHTSDRDVNRMMHVNATSSDLLAKLEAVRLVCQETGCAQRYLAMDAFNALFQATARIDADRGTDYHARFRAYLHAAQAADRALGIAMTDAKGDRSRRPHEQPVRKSYVHVSGRRPGGIVISGAKAIVTGAPYMHELLVLPGRAMTEADADFALACAVPIDAADPDTRSNWSCHISWGKPWPGSPPMRLACGTGTSSSAISAVSLERIPSFSSLRETLTPGRSVSITSNETPR